MGNGEMGRMATTGLCSPFSPFLHLLWIILSSHSVYIESI